MNSCRQRAYPKRTKSLVYGERTHSGRGPKNSGDVNGSMSRHRRNDNDDEMIDGFVLDGDDDRRAQYASCKEMGEVYQYSRWNDRRQGNGKQTGWKKGNPGLGSPQEHVFIVRDLLLVHGGNSSVVRVGRKAHFERPRRDRGAESGCNGDSVTHLTSSVEFDPSGYAISDALRHARKSTGLHHHSWTDDAVFA